MILRFGFSPCPNDTFIVHALLHGIAEANGITLEPVVEDVETLNALALEGAIDVSKLSFHAWLHVKHYYRLLQSGAALGSGVGPLLIGRKRLNDAEISEGPIALPGRYTTASLLFVLRYPEARNTVIMPFNEIEGAIIEGKVKGGVIIHENRFTYASKGLVKTIDLGEYWEQESNVAIPLGGFFIRRDLGEETANLIETLLRQSVQAAFADPSASEAFVRLHAQEMDPAVMQKHIELYVNTFTVDLGEEGNRAVTTLEQWAEQKNLLRV